MGCYRPTMHAIQIDVNIVNVYIVSHQSGISKGLVSVNLNVKT